MGNLNSSSQNIPPGSIALQNPLALEGIMKHLEVPDLLKCRLVSRLWSSIATKYLGMGGLIWIHLSPPFPHLKEIGRFLSTHRISHGLILSFCTPPWLESYVDYVYTTKKKSMALRDERYRDNCRIKEYDQQILEYISETGQLVDELRLEMKYMGASDSAFLIDFHTHLKHCVSVYLNIVDFSEEGWNSTGKWLPDSVTTLGISVAGRLPMIDYDNYVFTLSHCIQFLKGCSTANLQAINLVGLQFLIGRGDRDAWRLLLLMAVAIICTEDSESFPKLKCIRHEIHSMDDTIQLQNFPRDLKELHLYTEMKGLTESLPVLIKHASSLELLDLDLQWEQENPGTGVEVQVVLPPMPRLKRLDVTCDGRLCWEGWDERKMDVLGLRRILMDENFPLLETLSVFFFHDLFRKGYEIWHWIFQNGLENRGIKVLNVSLVADCSSPEIQRILNMFPSLKIFRHVLIRYPDRKHKHNFQHYTACEHRVQENSRRLITKWTSGLAKLQNLPFRPPDKNLLCIRLRDQLGGDGNLVWKRYHENSIVIKELNWLVSSKPLYIFSSSYRYDDPVWIYTS